MSVDPSSAHVNDPPEAGSAAASLPADIKSKLNMPRGCRCGFYQTEEGDPEFFLWHYLTQCPIGPKDHKAVWRPAFKGIIDSCMGVAQIEGGAQIVIDGGDVSILPRFQSWVHQSVC